LVPKITNTESKNNKKKLSFRNTKIVENFQKQQYFSLHWRKDINTLILEIL